MSKAKEKIIASIPKDKKKILGLWEEAKLQYKKIKSAIEGNHFSVAKRHNTLMRKAMNDIGDIALNDYGIEKLSHQIANTFHEFGDDFWGWWLKDIPINTKEWNTMENFYHTVRTKIK